MLLPQYFTFRNLVQVGEEKQTGKTNTHTHNRNATDPNKISQSTDKSENIKVPYIS